MKFFTKFDHADPVSPSGDLSVTQQQYLSDCNIDVILKRYRIGEPLPVTSRRAISGDFTGVGDYMSCLERVRNADQEFRSLPAELRARFGDSPLLYYKFVLDPRNEDECVKLGLRERKATDETAPIKVTVVNPSDHPSSPGDGASTPVTT